MIRLSFLPEPAGRFLADESGAVTVDWVVLTAAIIGMGLVALNQLFTGTGDLASTTSEMIGGIEIVEQGPVGFGG